MPHTQRSSTTPPKPKDTLCAGEAVATPASKHKGAITKLAHKVGENVGFFDGRQRIGKIAYDSDPPIWHPDTVTYFARRNEVVCRSNTPTGHPTSIGAVILLKPEVAIRFLERHVVKQFERPFKIEVKTNDGGNRKITVSGSILATVFFTDKRCSNKEIFVDNQAKNKVECWVLSPADANSFPYPVFVTFGFVDQENLECPPSKALQLGRQGVHLAPASRLSGSARARAKHKLEAEAAAQEAEQRKQERLARERLREKSQKNASSISTRPRSGS